jgi:4-hydroxythreonine-4-phosphate dehydrogenase
MMSPKRLLLTAGEPAGIGPDVIIDLAQEDFAAELIVIADPDLLHHRAQQLGYPLTLIEWNDQAPAAYHQKKSLKIIPVKQYAPSVPGVLNSRNSPYVIETLSLAASLCRTKKADALVTGPVHKEIINEAGIPFAGHTEFFAKLDGERKTVMLFVLNQPKLKVALATTHLPLSRVPNAITSEHLESCILILDRELQTHFQIASPKIYVCGLNPHAGEGGYLGREEIEIIQPCIEKLKSNNISVIGPLSADTLFTAKYLEQADAVLAMYHDQALPLVKYLGFGNAVNVTLGLDFIRTSVDHGTALELAGTRKADAGSMREAIHLAIEMSLKN